MNTTIQYVPPSLLPHLPAARTAIREAFQHVAAHAAHDDLTSPYTWLRAPYQDQSLEEIITRLVPRTLHNDVIILVGIGGAVSSTLALMDITKELRTAQTAQFWHIDTLDPHNASSLIMVVRELIASDARIQLVVATKSGTTLETTTIASILWKQISEHPAQPTPIIISDEGTALMKAAEKEQWDVFALSPALSGRFGVCSPLTFVPLVLMGIDIHELHTGAQRALQELLETPEQIVEQAAFYLAAYRTGYTEWELMVEQSNLISYGFWLRQLIAESLGKRACNQTAVGFTPLLSIATSDYHSQLQRTLGGPATIVSRSIAQARATEESAHTVPETLFTQSSRIVGTSLATLHESLCTAVHSAYHHAHVPHEMLTFSAEEPVAALVEQMYRDMIVITTLGLALNVDPFSQPHVQSYKKEAYNSLVNQSSNGRA